MEITHLTSQNFQEEVQNSSVLIDFWAPWCGPCRMLAPVMEEVAKEAPNEYKICKVNIDEHPELAAQFQVMSIPTLVVLKKGKQIASTQGVQDKRTILKLLEK